jgi:hypothetical protein
LKQMEMSKACDAGEMTIALAPDLDKFGFTTGCDAKSIHGDEHDAGLLQDAVVRKRWLGSAPLGWACAARYDEFRRSAEDRVSARPTRRAVSL